MLLWGGVIFYKLVSLQVVHHQEYVHAARQHQEVMREIPAPRGTIFDRNGQPLAMSIPTEDVYVNPLKVPDIGVAADILSQFLHMDRVELYGKLKSAQENDRGYLIVKKKITFDEGQHLRNVAFDWIKIQTESQRHYPKGRLAAHVLGGVDFSEHGNGGVEKALDADLQGIPGMERMLTDVKRRGIDSQNSTEARPGTAITLTLDERLQFVAERELAAGVHRRHSGAGQLSHVRSQCSAGIVCGRGGPAESRYRCAFRTGISLQDHHSFGGAGDHAPAAGNPDRLRPWSAHPLRTLHS
ncbi:hypothetical protein SBA3_2130008 [Candidatus Sulfopaludibacter sp. SbA3]|nr:hypothetical protein SBA3_2130008 [Candidatus Sulfopaludibacter sp. SbA3]